MITTIKGNILDIDRGIIVHGCNAHGVMGAGIAAQIKSRFPEAYAVYAKSNLQLGYNTYVKVGPSKYIVNAITQKSIGIGKQVSYDAIEDCFLRLRDKYMEDQICFATDGEYLPICFPMIGAGLGGGNWEVIRSIIDQSIPDTIEKRLYVL